jgi:hypothetical protein
MARIFDNLAEAVIAWAVSAAAAVVVAVGAFVRVAFAGAKFFRDEWSYGIGLAFAFPAMLPAGATTFLLLAEEDTFCLEHCSFGFAPADLFR